MTELRITDPEKVEKKEVSSQGRVYVGKEYAGQTVLLVVKDPPPSDTDGGTPDAGGHPDPDPAVDHVADTDTGGGSGDTSSGMGEDPAPDPD